MKNYFKDRREELEKSQSQVAREVGVTHGAVQHWEDGTSFPNPELYDALGKSLGTTGDRIAREVARLGRVRAATKRRDVIAARAG